MKFSILNLIFCIFAVSGSATVCQSQIENGEFDHQFGTSPDWWWGHGGCSVTRTSEQANEGTYAALVSDRTEYWQGAAQELNGDLEVGKDYHFQCWVRTKDVPSGVIRIEIAQEDDRGDRYFPIAKVLANDSQWTLLEGGFHFLANGNVDDLRFFISGDFTDDRLFDFYVDSVTITENDWRAAADARIEQFRKRDVVLSFVDQDGNPISDVDVEIKQIGHRFAFGSTLNDGFIDYDVYADFFRQNFQWATIEWYSQWKPVEEVRGVEDYTRADATVAFARENGIQLRGHALAWPDTRFMPTWLQGLSPQQHRDEINERIDNVVSRYSGQLVHWDVNNEMLNYSYFEDVVGTDIRASMFKRARENDSDVKLFTNEFGLTESGYKATRYRQLVQQLQQQGADVGGIGLQSHFDSNVSPKALELTLAKLTDLGPEIWFTEFDVSNPDPVERAKLLETFYRYAFSVPEAKGIIMWGFWAGNHWRGADASIVDLNWEINAAGQKYFDLMDQWTTSVSTSVSGGNNTVAFRGFHGSYLIKTTAQGIENYHFLSVEPDAISPANIVLKHNSDPEVDQTLVVYGTPGDDRFDYDLARPTMVEINDVISEVPAYAASEKITFVGNGGDDELRIVGSAVRERLFMTPTRVSLLGTSRQANFLGIRGVNCIAGSERDQIIISGSGVRDEIVSAVDLTQWMFAGRIYSAHGFGNVTCRPSRGDDSVVVLDSVGDDAVGASFGILLDVRGSQTIRRFYGFESNEMISASGSDLLNGQLAAGTATVVVSPTQAEITSNGSSFLFSGFAFSNITAADANDQTLKIDVSQNSVNDRVYISEEYASLRSGSNDLFRLINFSEINTETAFNDLLIVQDGQANDSIIVDEDRFTFFSSEFMHRGLGAGRIIANSSNGGTDTAEFNNSQLRVRANGDWIFD